VRELENAIRRAVVVADDTLRPEHLPARILRELGEEAVEGMDQSGVEGTAGALPASRSGAELFQVLPLREVERRAIMHAYEATGRNISEMTRLLRVGRTTLYRKLKSYGVAFDAE
jgi:DNA-binding NtrC family response regulator